MSQNRLGITTVVLLVLVGLTFWRMNARRDEDKAPPKLDVKLPKIERDKLDELELSSPDKPTVRLVKQGAQWRLAEPLDAKADQDAVKAALDKLGELEVTGIAATKAANHERLEVDAKKGTHVIARAAGKPVIDGWLGSYQSGNTMFRLQGQDPVATVKGSIRYAFNKLPREWRDRTISKLETKDVQQITFDNKNGHLDFVRAGEDWKQVIGKRDKRVEPLDQSKIKGIVGSAASLSAADFAAPNATPEQAGLGLSAGTLELRLSGDAGERRIIYRIGSEKDQNYYLQREGTDTVYMVSSWIGGRLLAGPDALIKKEAEAAQGENAMPPGMMPPGMMPPGMMPPGMHPGGMNQQGIPDEILRKLAAQQRPQPAAAKPAATKP